MSPPAACRGLKIGNRALRSKFYAHIPTKVVALVLEKRILTILQERYHEGLGSPMAPDRKG